MRRKAIAFGRKGASGRADGGSGQAREAREPLNRPAHLIYGGGALRVDVLLRDMSENGARVVAARPLPDLDEPSLAFQGRTWPCRVVWRRDGALGLRFTGAAKRA